MIKLGLTVEDIITGYIGVAVERVEFLDGTANYGVVKKCSENGEITPVVYFWENRLKIVDNAIRTQLLQSSMDNLIGKE